MSGGDEEIGWILGVRGHVHHEVGQLGLKLEVFSHLLSVSALQPEEDDGKQRRKSFCGCFCSCFLLLYIVRFDAVQRDLLCEGIRQF